MEKNVDKLFDEMLDSVMEFDNKNENSSFNVWNIDEDYEENEVEDVDKSVEKVENNEEINENNDKTPVENFENEVLEQNDFDSLLSSSEEFNIDWEDNKEVLSETDIEQDDKLVLEDVVENLKNNSIEDNIDEIDKDISKNKNISKEELLNILDQTDNSDDFFKKIEEIEYD